MCRDSVPHSSNMCAAHLLQAEQATWRLAAGGWQLVVCAGCVIIISPTRQERPDRPNIGRDGTVRKLDLRAVTNFSNNDAFVQIRLAPGN
jgi:hypothetical protein